MNRTFKLWYMKKENGKHFIMVSLNFTVSNLFVDLDLFSVHYPPLTSIRDTYVTKSLKSISSTIPLDFKFESVIETCLEKLNFDTKPIRIIY